jgi:hypothetical protein
MWVMNQNLLAGFIRHENKHGNWWYEGDVCECGALIHNSDNDYCYHYAKKGKYTGLRIIRCKDCYIKKHKVRNDESNSVTAKAIIASGCSSARDWESRSKEFRKEWRKKVRDEVEDIAFLHTVFPKPSKREFKLYTPMTSYISTERTGEDVPDGPVYVAQNPLTPDIQKVGKTFPNGISAILSAARRFGPAILVYEQWFPFAFEAEQAVHKKLAQYNLRKIRGINPETGQYDCGKELFQCSVETVIKAIEEVRIEFRKKQKMD